MGTKAMAGTTGRPWRCPDCGKQLGEKVLTRGGYARLVLDFAAVRRVEVCGREVRVACPRCQAVKVWHTESPGASVQTA